ncbi:hypothetical protein BGX30_012864 [Mortierella sp. GBA39]|nr:hypothetical protein BGX30_012864 [Mortierella sp. GBA39]
MKETARCFSFRLLRRRTTMTFLVSLVITVLLLSKIFPYAWIDFGYLARPIWDKDPYIWNETIVHYYSEGLTMQERCHAHGWTYTPQGGALAAAGAGVIDNDSDAMTLTLVLALIIVQVHLCAPTIDHNRTAVPC